MRNPAFDGLRAFAVTAVIAHHAELAPGGFLGVDVFFVLSGYLITSILAAEVEATGQINVWRFLYNRALRLWPALLAMLVFVLIIGPYLWPSVNIALVAGLAAFYLTDYVGSAPVVGHTWSLSVEQHFYLLWPLVMLSIAPMRKRAKLHTLLLLFVVSTCWRLGNALYFDTFESTGMRFDTRLSGLILGSALAISGLTIKGRAADICGFAAIIVLALLVSTASLDGIKMALIQPAIDIASAMLILSLAMGSRMARIFSWRPFVYTGLVSYGIYLWHYPLTGVLVAFGVETPAILLPAVFLLSLAVATISFELMERRLRNLRHRA